MTSSPVLGSDEDVIRGGTWFIQIPDAIQRLLLSSGRVVTFEKDERIFSRGQGPDGLYCVIRGRVRVSGVDPDGDETLLIMLEPPMWFGEISTIDGGERTHDSSAELRSEVLHVSQADVERIGSLHPDIWRHLGTLMGRHLRLMFQAFEDVARFSIRIRLARRLAQMVETYGEGGERKLKIHISQQTFALMLFTTRPTVNALLNELRKMSIVRLRNAEIEVVDLASLQRATQHDWSLWPRQRLRPRTPGEDG